jgi:hypothetical protein
VTADPILALYDRNVWSWLDERPAELAVVLQALDEGRVRFIYTRILDEAFSESPSLTKRDESTTQGMPCSHSPLMVRGL